MHCSIHQGEQKLTFFFKEKKKLFIESMTKSVNNQVLEDTILVLK